MGKIGSFFEYEQKSILKVVLQYVGTLALVLILCIYFLIENIAGGFMESRTEEYFLLFIVMALAGVFFTESCLRGIRTREIAVTGYILSVIFALLWLILDVLRNTGDSEIADYYLVVTGGFYILCLVGISVITIIRETGLPFEQYTVRVVFSIIRVNLIFLVLNLGFLFIFFLIDKLIANIDIWTWLYRLELLLAPFIYIPYILSCLTNRTEEKPSRFARGLVLYALMPMYIAAVAIVYIYIIRILITWTFPVNQIFIICAVLFAAGFLVWTMAYAFTRHEEKKLYYILIRYMKYIVSPFIIMELYALIIRINAYGWTVARVIGIWFIVIQVVYIAWEPLINLMRLIFRMTQISYGEHYEWMIYVILAAFFFCFIFPWTSGLYVEDISQENRLEDFVEELEKMNNLNRDLTPEEYKTVAKLQYEGKSTVSVLERNIYGKVYLKSKYRDAQLTNLFSMPDTPKASTNNEEYDEWAYSTYYTNGYPTSHLSVSIDEFKTFSVISTYYSYEDILSMKELKQVRFGYGVNKVIVADISDIVRDMVEQPEGQMTDPTTLFTVTLSAGQKIIITSISFRYSDVSDQVKNLQIEGYLFLP